jgi:uncharacterized YigZ family protein
LRGNTLTQPVFYACEVKKSRFIVHAAPITHIDDAQNFCAEHRSPQASHHCWAWRLQQQYRFFDDGEPSGTAGRPILQAIDQQHLDAVVVLVIRWFGGIKLGTGGLARAYGGAAAECLRTAEKITLVPKIQISLCCDYAAKRVLYKLIETYQGQILHVDSGIDQITAELSLPTNQLPLFDDALRNATRGTATIRVHSSLSDH